MGLLSVGASVRGAFVHGASVRAPPELAALNLFTFMEKIAKRFRKYMIDRKLTELEYKYLQILYKYL